MKKSDEIEDYMIDEEKENSSDLIDAIISEEDYEEDW
jgi:hypothetical protein